MPLDRQSFLIEWLEDGTPKAGYTKFKHKPLREVIPLRPEAIVPLSQAIVDHHFHLSRVNDWLEDLGFQETRAELDKELKFDHNTKLGNFGEVIASEALVQREGYKIPVFKLRFRDGKLPMRGEDIIAFRINENESVDLVIVGEAKVRATFDYQAVASAFERLESSYKPHPQTLSLISEVLYNANRNDEGRAIDALKRQLATGAVQQEHWIVILSGNAPDDPFRDIDPPKGHPPLVCADLPLDDITGLIDRVFTPSNDWEAPNGS